MIGEMSLSMNCQECQIDIMPNAGDQDSIDPGRVDPGISAVQDAETQWRRMAVETVRFLRSKSALAMRGEPARDRLSDRRHQIRPSDGQISRETPVPDNTRSSRHSGQLRPRAMRRDIPAAV